MKTFIGIVAALALVGCETHQATPSAAPVPVAYPAKNMSEFDAAQQAADDNCYKKNDLKRAQYVDRTFDSANFECVSR
jgi:hypothetical protein